MNSPGPMCNPSHPGAVLRDGWLVNGLSEPEAARLIGIPLAELSSVLRGHAPISPRLALCLERAGWSDASLWMRLQAAYDLAQERLRQAVAA